MKRRGWMAAAAALACFAAAAVLNGRLAARRERGAVGLPEGAPPWLSFTTVVLGGFRGTVADLLWLRASALQEQGRFVELSQLAEWVTALEPRLPDVWAFHAWNLAYNVSVMLPDAEERWRWVREGLYLLRDRALPVNPDSPALHGELAWMLLFKVGGTSDRAFPVYRRRWVDMVEDALDGVPALGAGEAARQDPALSARLRERLGLDPAFMRRLETEAGPIDWRVPAAQAYYWAARGLQAAAPGDQVMCRRLVYQSLATLVFAGRATRGAGGEQQFAPSPSLIPAASRAFEETIRRYQDRRTRDAYAAFREAVRRARLEEAVQP
jgi:hypothetical protein